MARRCRSKLTRTELDWLAALENNAPDVTTPGAPEA
jgi:hypothetical protein